MKNLFPKMLLRNSSKSVRQKGFSLGNIIFKPFNLFSYPAINFDMLSNRFTRINRLVYLSTEIIV